MPVCTIIIGNAKFNHIVKGQLSPLYLISYLLGDALSSQEDHVTILCPEDF